MNKIRNKYLKMFITTLIILNLTASSGVAATFRAGGVRLNKNVKTMKELKQKNVVTQSLDFSCGAAGLSTMLNYYHNDPVTEQQIIKSLLQIVPMQKVQERKGFSLFDLKKYVEAQGYEATGYKMDFDFLRELGKPALVPIKFKNYRHFVIVKGILSDRVFIADPAVGNVSLKIDKFKNIWTNGIGLVINKKDGVVDGDYALKVKEEDLRIADYKSMRNVVSRNLIRTAIYTNEY